MENISLELVFSKTQEKELEEMKTNDQEVTKLFETVVPKVQGFNMAWLIKIDDTTIGYTDLIAEQGSLMYYMDLALKPGYRTKEIIIEVLNIIKKQALSSNIYLETSIDRNVLNDVIKELDISKRLEKNKRKVYKLNNK